MRVPRWYWLLLIPLAIGLLRLDLDVEILNLLPARNPAVEGLRVYQEHFANAGELIISVETADANLTGEAARSLAGRLRLETVPPSAGEPPLIGQVHWQPPWLENPGHAAELFAYLWLNQPPEIFDQLAKDLAPENLGTRLQQTLERLATSFSPSEISRLGYDPFNLMHLPESLLEPADLSLEDDALFASADGRFRLLFVQPGEDVWNYRVCMRWFDSVQQAVRQWRESDPRFDQVRVAYTGRPAFVSEIAGGMEGDITRSVLSTALIIALLFWWMHRRFLPLLYLLLLLGLVLIATFAVGGLVFGALNVVSAGFAAILLGLGVDYGMVLYQESRLAPADSAREIRRKIAPGIIWSAATTGGAFLALNLSGLPGLGQLGFLVAAGVALAAASMLWIFLPLIVGREKDRLSRAGGGGATGSAAGDTAGGAPGAARPAASVADGAPPFLSRPTVIWALTAGIVLCAGTILWFGLPPVNAGSDPLRPRQSQAHAALDYLKERMGQAEEPLWLLATARDASEMARLLDRAESVLARAQQTGSVAGYKLSTTLWPRPEFQLKNKPTAKHLADQLELLQSAAQDAGFTPAGLDTTEQILATWSRAAALPDLFWPTNPLSRWILDQFIAQSDPLRTIGFVRPTPSPQPEANAAAHPIAEWAAELPPENFLLAGWDLLGLAVLEVVKRDLVWVLLPMAGLLLGALSLAFRRFSEVLLSLAVLLVTALALWATMKAAGWSWNLLNLMALPILLGISVDYSIHVQMALRRLRGDISAVRRSTGRALFLCSATTVTAFTSLSWSGNAGLASLGQVCAVGVAWAFVTSVILLPVWWRSLEQPELTGPVHPDNTAAPDVLASNPGAVAKPSSFYRARWWRLGLAVARSCPSPLAARFSLMVADVYWLLNSRRRQVIIDNLLPACDGDRRLAGAAGRRLLRQFSRKLLDLWHYENGRPIAHLFSELGNWDQLVAARAQGRGVLLLTPHLGNWELGGPLLRERGIQLQVISLAEPDSALTRMRQEARARWGIETLVLGENPFGFIEVIRRLEAGATVALLMDRPPPPSSVTVRLFNRPFAASIAAAELARASGCMLLPVYLPRTKQGYSARLLPEIAYDRRALGRRPARVDLTQTIISAFEPVIKQHLTQWYHFVPIWPEQTRS